MKAQSQILRTLSTPEGLDAIRRILREHAGNSRRELAETICKDFNFIDNRDRYQICSCLNAVDKLTKKGEINFPEPSKRNYKKNDGSHLHKPPTLDIEIPKPKNIPDNIAETNDFSIHRVVEEKEKLIFNTILDKEHKYGIKKFVGQQIFYTVKYKDDILACFVFSMGSFQLKDRDLWIGWDREKKERYRDRIICMNRFLLREGANKKNFASKLISLIIERCVSDYKKIYGIDVMLIESFADDDQYGGCYRASNWIKIGKTKGKGRNYSKGQELLSKKKIFIYVVDKQFRSKLDIELPEKLQPLGIYEGLNEENWIHTEFGNANLGDKRLTESLMQLVTILYMNMGSTISQAAHGNSTILTRGYNFIEYKDKNKVNYKTILEPHINNTINRIKNLEEDYGIVVSDTTKDILTSKSKTEGLGVIGTNQTGAQSYGLEIHENECLTKKGVNLGFIGVICRAPKLRTEEEKKHPDVVPEKERKTYVWKYSYRKTIDVAKQAGKTLIFTTDREGDFFELLYIYETEGKKFTEVVIRCKHNRQDAEDNIKIYDKIINSGPKFCTRIDVPRKSYRPKLSKQKEQEKVEFRKAKIEIFACRVLLAPPSSHKDKSPVSINFIYLNEIDPPEDAKPVCWRLLTSLSIETIDDILECIRIYNLRWRIEDLHRVVKNTCGIEKISYRDAVCMTRHIAISLVIANRIMMITQLARTQPNLPADTIFSSQQIFTLNILAKKYNLCQADTLSNAIRIVAVHGGFTDRKSDTAGYEIISQGMKNLYYTDIGAKGATEAAVNKLKEVAKNSIKIFNDMCKHQINEIKSSKTLEECKKKAEESCMLLNACLYILALQMIYGTKMLC